MLLRLNTDSRHFSLAGKVAPLGFAEDAENLQERRHNNGACNTTAHFSQKMGQPRGR